MKNSQTTIKNQRGIATIEAVSLLVLFAVMIGYSIGTFGVIHSGIVNSIAARAYAFETFRNRVDLTYWRDDRAASENVNYRPEGFRIHGIVSENQIGKSEMTWVAAQRRLSLSNDEGDNVNNIISSSATLSSRGERDRANPVNVKIVYGICLDNICAGRQR